MKNKFIDYKLKVPKDYQKVIFDLKKYCLENNFPINEIILLESRANDIEELYRTGRMGVDEYSRKLMEIKSSILHFIDEISEDDTIDDVMNWWKSLPYEWEKIFHRIIGENPNRKKIEYLLTRDYMEIESNEIKSLDPLRMFENLEEVFIISSTITDLSALKTQENIKILILRNLPSQEIIESIHLNKIETFEATSCQIHDLSFISNFSKTYSFYVTYTPITNIEYLKNSPISYLRISNTKITDVSIIKYFDKLDELHLIGKTIQNIYPIKELNNLFSLVIEIDKTADINCIKHLKRLKFLEIKSPIVENLKYFKKMDLRELTINYSIENISMEEIYEFRRTNPKCRFNYYHE